MHIFLLKYLYIFIYLFVVLVCIQGIFSHPTT